MRQALVSLNEMEGASIQDILGSDFGILEGLEEATPAVTDVFAAGGLAEEGIFFLLINLVIYLCGFLAAFYRHDAHPDYEKLIKNWDKKRNMLEAIRSRYEGRTEDVNRKYRAKYSFLEESGRIKEIEVHELEYKISEIKRMRESKIQEAIYAVSKQLNAYRIANLKARGTAIPSFFSVDSEIQLVELLAEK
jgi:hypothetical protein